MNRIKVEVERCLREPISEITHVPSGGMSHSDCVQLSTTHTHTWNKKKMPCRAKMVHVKTENLDNQQEEPHKSLTSSHPTVELPDGVIFLSRRPQGGGFSMTL